LRQWLWRPGGLLPVAGYFLFPVGTWQGYLNLKAYKEFDAQNRPDGWNAWLSFVISPAAPNAVAPRSRQMVTK